MSFFYRLSLQLLFVPQRFEGRDSRKSEISCALFPNAELSVLADLSCQLARTFHSKQRPEYPKASGED